MRLTGPRIGLGIRPRVHIHIYGLYRYVADLDCPSCGRAFDGTGWAASTTVHDITCPGCNNIYEGSIRAIPLEEKEAPEGVTLTENIYVAYCPAQARYALQKFIESHPGEDPSSESFARLVYENDPTLFHNMIFHFKSLSEAPVE